MLTRPTQAYANAVYVHQRRTSVYKKGKKEKKKKQALMHEYLKEIDHLIKGVNIHTPHKKISNYSHMNKQHDNEDDRLSIFADNISTITFQAWLEIGRAKLEIEA